MTALTSDLRKRVVIEEPTETPDTGGGFTTSWDEFTTVWAAFRPLRGNENVDGNLLQTTVTHKVTIRYLEGLTTKMRLRLGDRLFNIRAILNREERNEMLELTVEEGVAQ